MSREIPRRSLSPVEKEMFASVCKTAKLINSTLEISQILQSLLDTAIQVTGAERGAIFFKEDAGPGNPEFRIGRDLEAAAFHQDNFVPSMTAIRKVLNERKPLITDNAPADFDQSKSIVVSGIISILCVPLISPSEDLLGVIYLDSRAVQSVFSGKDGELLEALSDLASAALYHALLYHLLDKSYMGAVHCLARSIGYKDPYTLEHCQRVSQCSRKIAVELKLDENFVREIETSALLHDVGKIGIPEAVLQKPEALSEAERRAIERHPSMGHEILASLELSKNVKLGILHHQERFDGSGYPDRLAGEKIPMIARIIAVADAWDAMTSDRAYRKALPPEAALHEIKNNAGLQFDPKVVSAFLRVAP